MNIPRLALLLLTLSGLSPASIINYTLAPTSFTGWVACSSYQGFSCGTTAAFDSVSLNARNNGDISPLFVSAFDTWNTDGWRLVNGGTLAGEFTVNVANAVENGVSGGAAINIGVGDLSLPNLNGDDVLAWVQGLFVNYTLSGIPPILSIRWT